MRLAPGLRADPLESCSAPPDPIAVITGRGGRGEEGKGWELGGEEGERREGLGYLPRCRRVPGHHPPLVIIIIIIIIKLFNNSCQTQPNIVHIWIEIKKLK